MNLKEGFQEDAVARALAEEFITLIRKAVLELKEDDLEKYRDNYFGGFNKIEKDKNVTGDMLLFDLEKVSKDSRYKGLFLGLRKGADSMFTLGGVSGASVRLDTEYSLLIAFTLRDMYNLKTWKDIFFGKHFESFIMHEFTHILDFKRITPSHFLNPKDNRPSVVTKDDISFINKNIKDLLIKEILVDILNIWGKVENTQIGFLFGQALSERKVPLLKRFSYIKEFKKVVEEIINYRNRKYFSSPEEFNAFYQQTIALFENLFFKMSEREKNKVLSLPPEKFVEYVISLNKMLKGAFGKFYEEKYKQKFLKRAAVYQLELAKRYKQKELSLENKQSFYKSLSA